MAKEKDGQRKLAKKVRTEAAEKAEEKGTKRGNVVESKGYGKIYLVKAKTPERAYITHTDPENPTAKKKKFLCQITGPGSHMKTQWLREELGKKAKVLPKQDLLNLISKAKALKFR